MISTDATNSTEDVSSTNMEKPNRILGYDLARSFAIFGMILVHFRLATQADTGSAWLIQLSHMLEGRAAATFVLLAGVGVTLATQKVRLLENPAEIFQKRISLFKRSLLLVVTGLCYAPIWQADILHIYGFYIAIGTLLFTLSDRVLWMSAFLFTAAFPVLLFFFDYETGWNWETLHYNGFWTTTGMIRHIFYNGFNPVFPWTAFLLIGMWLGRQDLQNPRVRKFLIMISLSVLLITETVSAGIVTSLADISLDLPKELVVAIFGTKPMPPMPQFILAGSSVAILVVILCVSISLKFPNSSLLKPLYHTGQLSLSIYVGHVIFGLGFLEEMDWLTEQSIEFAVSSGVIFIVLSIIFSHLWRSRFSQGPLEAVFRYLSA